MPVLPPVLLFGELRRFKLCGWYYNLYRYETKEPVIGVLSTESNKTVLLSTKINQELKFDEKLINCVTKQVRRPMLLPVLHHL